MPAIVIFPRNRTLLKVDHHFFTTHFCCWYKVRLGENDLIRLLTIVMPAMNSAGGGGGGGGERHSEPQYNQTSAKQRLMLLSHNMMCLNKQW